MGPPRSNPGNDPQRDSAGTGVFAAWWQSAHASRWLLGALLVLIILAALAWWLWP